MDQPREDLSVTRAEIAEFMAENGDDPLDVYDFLIGKGLSQDAAERILGTLDSY